MYPYIVADIGGTNARFGLVTASKNNQPVIENIEVLDGTAYETLQKAMRAYIDQIGIATPKSACVAVAGPIEGDEASMTNLNWSFTQSGIKKEFKFEKFSAINDFTALALASSQLQKEDLIVIREGKIEEFGNKAILGPGTGLGVGGLVHSSDGWLPIPSEGGHANIAPATDLECEIIKAAIAQHGHVSAEIFISGPGLVRLYKALASVRDQQAQDLEPKDVTAKALDNSDALCHETLQLFCSFIGNFSGNLALTYGAKGGVYLAGGILPRFVDFLRGSEFNHRFEQKGVMSHFLEDIPVSIMSHEQPGLLGSAIWGARRSS